MPIKRDIVYPIFLKTIPFTKDNFWKDTFENLSYSICPNGCYISKGFLCSNVKGKEFVYKFIDKDVEQIYKDIYKLLKEKLNIMSKNEPFETGAIPRLVAENQLMAYQHTGFWQPMDTLREKQELAKLAQTPTPPWLIK